MTDETTDETTEEEIPEITEEDVRDMARNVTTLGENWVSNPCEETFRAYDLLLINTYVPVATEEEYAAAPESQRLLGNLAEGLHMYMSIYRCHFGYEASGEKFFADPEMLAARDAVADYAAGDDSALTRSKQFKLKWGATRFEDTYWGADENQ